MNRAVSHDSLASALDNANTLVGAAAALAARAYGLAAALAGDLPTSNAGPGASPPPPRAIGGAIGDLHDRIAAIAHHLRSLDASLSRTEQAVGMASSEDREIQAGIQRAFAQSQQLTA